MDLMTLPSQMPIGALPPAQKSAIRRWYESINRDSAQASMERAKLHLRAGVEGVRATGEAGVAGAILGAIHATVGLDRDVGGVKVPIDGAAAVAMVGCSAVFAHEALSGDMRNIGTTAAGIYAFRKVYDVVAAMRKREGKAIPQFAGEEDDDMGSEDPIVKVAKCL